MTRRALYRLAAALCCMAVCLTPLCGLADADITMQATMGYGGVVTYVRKLPVTVTLANNGPDLEGVLTLDVNRSATEYDRYQLPVSVAAGASVQVTMPVVLTQKQKTYTLRLMQGTQALIEQDIQPEAVLNPYTLMVGTLSQDASSLQYLAITQSNDALARAEYWTPVALDAQTFPTDVESLRAFDMLAVDGVDLFTLSSEQQQAFDQWLRRGGVALIGGGAKAQENFAFFQQYTGVSAGAVTKEANVSGRLMETLGIKGQGMEEENTVTVLEGAAGANLGGLMDITKVDQGYVITAAFSLTEKPLSRWMGMNVIWQRVMLAGVPSAYRNMATQRSTGSYNTQNGHTDEGITSQIDIPSGNGAEWPLVLMGAFVVLVGLGSYLLLQKLDKREWMWLTVPVLAAVAALGMWGLSSLLPIRQPVAVRFSLVDVDQNGGVSSYTVVTAAKADRQPLTISFSGGDIDMASTIGYYVNDNQSEPEAAKLRYTYTYGSPDAITCQLSRAWQLNNFMVRNVPMKDAGGISGQCGWEKGEMVFTLFNGSGLTLSEGLILTEKGFAGVPELLPGQSATCTMRPMTDEEEKEMRNGTYTLKEGVLLSDSMRGNYSPYEMVDNYFTEKRKQAPSAQKSLWDNRRSMVSAGQAMDAGENTFYYIAFCSDLDELEVTVDGQPVTRQAQSNCIQARLTYNPISSDGTAHFLSGSFPVSLASQEEGRKPVIGEPLASSGSYYGYRSYMLSANPMFAIDMTALPRNMEISSFTLGSRYNYYNYQVSLYNQVSGDWEVWNRYVVNRTTGQGDWEENGVPNLDKYARDGYLYVRFEKSGSTEDYADVSEPQLTVEGRVK